MSNEDELRQEQVFADWLDGKLGASHADDDSDNDSLWQQRKRTASNIAYQVSMSGEQSVPKWDRTSAFTSDKVAFWQWRGWPVLSMGLSLLAVALVLFKVELVIQDNTVLLSFANANSHSQDEKIAQLVDMKLQQFAQEQQVLLANYAADIKVKQQDNNLQLASYIMGVSRQERKEDISDFIQYINAERKDEQLEQKIKYQALEQAIKYQKSYQRDDINDYGLNPGDIKRTPANWTAEE